MKKYFLVIVAVPSILAMESDEGNTVQPLATQLKEIWNKKIGIVDAVKKGFVSFGNYIAWDRDKLKKELLTFFNGASTRAVLTNFFQDYDIIVWADGREYPWPKFTAEMKSESFKRLQEELKSIGNKVGLQVSDIADIPSANLMDMLIEISKSTDLPTMGAYLLDLPPAQIFALIRATQKYNFEQKDEILFFLCGMRDNLEEKEVVIPPDIRSFLASFKVNIEYLFKHGILPKQHEDPTLLYLNRCCLSDISQLPHFFSAGYLATIKKVEAIHNRLTESAPAILLRTLPALEDLALNYNNIRILNEEFLSPFVNENGQPKPFALRQLLLAHNNIIEIEAGWARDLPNLEILDLSNNKDLSNNGLSNAVLVPGWTWGLAKLKKLYLRNNRINRLSAGWLSGLKNLQVLDLRGNSLTDIEKGWSKSVSNLKKIIIDENMPAKVKNKINWELNGVLGYFGIRRKKVEIEFV